MSGCVDRVVNSLPHVQRTWASTYSGWILVFIASLSVAAGTRGAGVQNRPARPTNARGGPAGTPDRRGAPAAQCARRRRAERLLLHVPAGLLRDHAGAAPPRAAAGAR